MVRGLSKAEQGFFALARRQRATNTYRQSHRVVQRRLQTTGAGNRRVERMVNRVDKHQSFRANRQRLASQLAGARQRVGSIKTALATKSVRVKRASFGSKGG
ncbi:MAG: hypothetical protein [Bacteriophage sp.]|nr:MAG: hypothetical protein [Bacteriophage sp.]UWG70169.1 MAG: hypothetical protein [Bacteriophage sp.]UWG88673.1 MAG: hypothetical protein [Bacteriophage sp.]